MDSMDKDKPEVGEKKFPDHSLTETAGAGKHIEDSSFAFARHFVETGYGNIPGDVVEAVKKSVLDTLGVSIAATTLGQGGRALAEIAKEGGGKEESTLLVFGGKVPAWMAAFVNGGLAHSLDYDDLHHEGICHPGGAVLPAALAVAERVGPVHGRDFITAAALGQDMVMRMTAALRTHMLLYNWMRFPVIAVFAAAATSGKLLGLDQEKMQAAISAGLCYSAGAGELLRGELRGLYDGWANKGGIFAALMAQKGITGTQEPLEGQMGFFNVYYRGEYDRDVLLADLGKKYYGSYLGFKPWSSCSVTQPSIDATLKLVTEHDLKPEDIEEMTVTVGTQARFNCEPLEYVRKPKTVMDAKFSVPYTMAIAAVRRKVTLADFMLENINDPVILALAQRVVPVLTSELNVQRGTPPAVVEIKTKDGKKYTTRTDYVFGHYLNPMPWEAIIEKFRDCVSYSAIPLPGKNIAQVIEMAQNLEQVSDVGAIMRLLG